MTDNMPMMLYIATYDSVSAAMTDLAAIEQLHKDKVIGNPYVHLPRVLHLDPGLGLPRPVVLVPAHRGELRAVQRLGERGRRRLLRPRRRLRLRPAGGAIP